MGDGVTVEVTRERLKVRAWDWRTPGEPVGCYDAMDIAPDGRVSTPQQGELK